MKTSVILKGLFICSGIAPSLSVNLLLVPCGSVDGRVVKCRYGYVQIH